MHHATSAQTLVDDPRALGWERIHGELCRLAAEKSAYEADEARWLLAAWKARVHEPLGFGSFYEYVDRLLGYSRRFVAERLRVARALAELPLLCAAVRSGDVSWSAARELSRVATPETVAAWIDAARGETVRDVERAVAGRAPGDLPTDPPDDAVRRHVVRLQVEGETLALLRAARERLVVEGGAHVDDDALVRALARALLDRDAGGDDAGRAAYQLALHVCARCGAGHAEGGGELVRVDDAVVEAAHCDAQYLGPVGATHVGAADRCHGQHLGQHLSPVGTTHVGATDRDATGASTSRAEACDGAGRAGAPPARTHVGAPPPQGAAHPARRRRATQTIPPALRREIARRHHGRCAVPGCRQSGFVHQHHLIRRADGGAHDPDTMILLCEAHHRAVHEGYLAIEGTWSAGFGFRHADGRVYGARASRAGEPGARDWPSPTRQSRRAAAMRALRGTGRPEQEAHALVDRAAAHVGPDASAAELFRVAAVAAGWRASA